MTKEEAIEALFKAVKGDDGKRGNCDEVKLILDTTEATANEVKDGWSPLLLASCNGDEALVRLLLKYQAHAAYLKSAKGADESGERQMQRTANEDNENPFMKPPDSHKVGKYTPLHWAAYKGHLSVV